MTDRILIIGNTCIIVNGLNSYNDTLNFVPTMEVSGNEKAKKCEISTIHDSSDSSYSLKFNNLCFTFNQTTYHSVQIY